MHFIKNNLLLTVILIFCAILRINLDIFIPGYCFDEIAMVSIAKQQFPLEILKQTALLDYHAPLYYLIIHIFTYFHNEWLELRFFNLVLSIINALIFYHIGKEIKDKNTGLIAALLFSVSHITVSVVSFIKFYCLCFLLVSVSILFFIKSLKNKKFLWILGIINALYIYSATLGFIFVFLEYLVLFLNMKSVHSFLALSPS